MSRVVGSVENPDHFISRVSSTARIFSVHLSRTPQGWTEASLLFDVVALDQDTFPAYVEGFDHCGRSGAL
jgi:hypothetical protein